MELKFDGRALIDGKRVDAKDGAVFDCISPVDGRILTQVARCQAQDIDSAVVAARRAFEQGRWSKLAPAKRKQILIKFADNRFNNRDTANCTAAAASCNSWTTWICS